MQLMNEPNELTVGLIGYPLKYSLSPLIHNSAFSFLQINGKYELFPIRNFLDSQKGLRRVINAMRSGTINGLNVTKPYKKEILKFIDGCSPTVKMIGAANVLHFRDGRIIVENTDAAGFLTDLHSFFSSNGYALPMERRALVLGAGGAAQAVVFSLLKIGWQVIVVARNSNQAIELCNRFRSTQLSTRSLTINAIRSIGSINLIVNATPVGMYPRSVVPRLFYEIVSSGQAAFYDLVYAPYESYLVQLAKQNGQIATGGIGMLVEQAALSFEIWTGRTAPREAMRKAINSYIEKSSIGE